MQITPVHNHKEPSYPTKHILDDHPELLHLVPKRWQKNPVVLSVMAGVCMLMYGGSHAEEKASTADISQVAPVFMHGSGRGIAGFGGDMASTTHILSEDEARRIITDEARRAGINLEPDARTIEDVPVPVVSDCEFIKADSTEKEDASSQAAQKLSLLLDGTDPKYSISYEYVSQADYERWKITGQAVKDVSHLDAKDLYELLSSLDPSFNLLRTAETLKECVTTAKPNGTYAMFYDPMAPCYMSTNVWSRNMLVWACSPIIRSIQHISPDCIDWDHHLEFCSATHGEMMGASCRELRAQVRDFINWLKAQGVI